MELHLPPKDRIIYLARVADFHLSPNYCVFDYQAFVNQINGDGDETSSVQKSSSVWQVRLLLLIALGKLFLEKGADAFGPPGAKEYLEGVECLPSNIELAQTTLTSTEALALLAIYSRAADLHHAAYLYVRRFSGYSPAHADNQ